MARCRKVVYRPINVEMRQLGRRIKQSLLCRPKRTRGKRQANRFVFGAHGPKDAVPAGLKRNIEADQRNRLLLRFKHAFG
jgi:hypothetical protein